MTDRTQQAKRKIDRFKWSVDECFERLEHFVMNGMQDSKLYQWYNHEYGSKETEKWDYATFTWELCERTHEIWVGLPKGSPRAYHNARAGQAQWALEFINEVVKRPQAVSFSRPWRLLP